MGWDVSRDAESGSGSDSNYGSETFGTRCAAGKSTAKRIVKLVGFRFERRKKDLSQRAQGSQRFFWGKITLLTDFFSIPCGLRDLCESLLLHSAPHSK